MFLELSFISSSTLYSLIFNRHVLVFVVIINLLSSQLTEISPNKERQATGTQILKLPPELEENKQESRIPPVVLQ